MTEQKPALYPNFLNSVFVKIAKEVRSLNSSCDMTGAAVDSFDQV